MTPKKLTEKEALFVSIYVTCLNASKAAREAGYSPDTAGVIGYENLKKPHIQEAIKEEREKRRISIGFGKEDAIQIALRVLVADPADFVDSSGGVLPLDQIALEDRILIKGVSQKLTKEGIVTTYELMGKEWALTTLERLLGLSVAKIEMALTNLSEHELDSRIAEALQAIQKGEVAE